MRAPDRPIQRPEGPADRATPGRFLALAVALSLPFWALAALVPVQPLPGLPLSGLMAFCPAAAAAILVARQGGGPLLRAFLARAFDLRRMRGRLGWAPLIALVPAITLAIYAAQWASGTLGLPRPVPAWTPLAMLVAFFVAGLGEELGWSAYAAEPLARRFGELRAALLLGLIWFAWHVVPFLQAGRDWDWIAWKAVGMLATRVVMVRLYFGAGRSLFAVALFHALDNVAAFLAPMLGSAYDPRLMALTMGAAAIGLYAAKRPTAPPA